MVNFKARPMLNYFKKILEKVSFDRNLFEKELRKAINSLIAEEVEDDLTDDESIRASTALVKKSIEEKRLKEFV